MRAMPKGKVAPHSALSLEVKRVSEDDWLGVIYEDGEKVWSIHSQGGRERVVRALLQQVAVIDRPTPTTRIECNDDNGSLYEVLEPIQTVANRLAENIPFAWFAKADGGKVAIRPESVLALVELPNG